MLGKNNINLNNSCVICEIQEYKNYWKMDKLIKYKIFCLHDSSSSWQLIQGLGPVHPLMSICALYPSVHGRHH